MGGGGSGGGAAYPGGGMGAFLAGGPDLFAVSASFYSCIYHLYICMDLYIYEGQSDRVHSNKFTLHMYIS